MTAPTTTTRPARIPPGLAEILEKIDTHEGPWPLSSRGVAPIFGVTAKTVTGWATAELLGGMRLSDTVGWRFSKTDVRDFAIGHYHAARRR